MSEPMSAERLAEIRERDANTVARMYHTRMTAQERNHLWSDMDRRALLAEVDRLRAQVEAKPKTSMRYRVEVLRSTGSWVWWGTYGSLQAAIDKAEANCVSAYRVIDRETGKTVNLG